MPAITVDKSKILENFKSEITLVRGKKYTFTINTIEDGSIAHPFYISTSTTGGPGMPDVVTENVEHSYERNLYPNLSRIQAEVTESYGWFYDYPNDMWEINGSNAAFKSLRFRWNTDASKLQLDHYYLITYTSQLNAGNLRVNCGVTEGTLRSGTGENTYTEVLQMKSNSQFRDLNFVAGPNFTGNVSYVSIKEVGMVTGNFVFIPSYEHPDTLYYQCGTHLDMGGKINLINSPGAVLNDLEWWYTLGINQTNRTYPPTTSSDPAIVNKFLTGGLPAGLFKNIYNLPPTGSLNSDRDYMSYYDPPNSDAEVSLSGLISDPEDDTLRYKWRHFSPKTTIGGNSLLTDFDDDESLTTTATLVEPPTDMIYTLHLEIHDSDNITTLPIHIKVSGTVDFDEWDVGISGVNTFDLGDSNVPFTDLD